MAGSGGASHVTKGVKAARDQAAYLRAGLRPNATAAATLTPITRAKHAQCGRLGSSVTCSGYMRALQAVRGDERGGQQQEAAGLMRDREANGHVEDHGEHTQRELYEGQCE